MHVPMILTETDA